MDRRPTAASGGTVEMLGMTKRNWTLTALGVLLAIVLFAAGLFVGQRLGFRALNVQLRGVQATLLFDRIVEERAWKSLLERGCITVAIGEISNRELADRKTLSDFVREELDRDTIEYISKRDPNILSGANSTQGSYTNTWPGCQK